MFFYMIFRVDCLRKCDGKHTIKKLRVYMVFLIMNPRCSKHVEDTKN